MTSLTEFQSALQIANGDYVVATETTRTSVQSYVDVDSLMNKGHIMGNTDTS